MRLAAFAGVLAALTGGYFALAHTGVIALVESGAGLRHWLEQLGIIGPLAIILLMTMAIVMSPIPSAPVALAAGAAYGHTAGTLYVVIGAELGAVIAFLIGRLVGGDVMHKWIHGRLAKPVLDSQNLLMAVVFVSRLLPFVSFDMVSYAAGVTPLRFWRFAIATLAGIIPASFLLAHFGSELASGEGRRIGTTLLILAGISLAITLFNWISRRRP